MEEKIDEKVFKKKTEIELIKQFEEDHLEHFKNIKSLKEKLITKSKKKKKKKKEHAPKSQEDELDSKLSVEEFSRGKKENIYHTLDFGTLQEI